MWLSPSGQVAHATLDWRLRRTGIFTIAKILNLDDSSLKDVAYYPYDLVHYKK